MQIHFVEGGSCDDNIPCSYSDICTINEFEQKLCSGASVPIDDYNPCIAAACVGGTITHVPIDVGACAAADCDLHGLYTGGQCESPESCSWTPTDGGWSE